MWLRKHFQFFHHDLRENNQKSLYLFVLRSKKNWILIISKQHWTQTEPSNYIAVACNSASVCLIGPFFIHSMNTTQVIWTNLNEGISPEMAGTGSVHACNCEIRWDPETGSNILSSPRGTCCIWYSHYCESVFLLHMYEHGPALLNISTSQTQRQKPTFFFLLFSWYFTWLITTVLSNLSPLDI